MSGWFAPVARRKAPEVTGTAPAPGSPRPTVVLRVGPSKRRGRIADISTGVVGLVLLVAAVLMLDILPVEDLPPNEFRVTFIPVTTNMTLQVHRLTEDAQNYDFIFNITEDDVYQIDLRLSFHDDIAASGPDQFRYEVYRNDGESADQPESLTNAPGRLQNGTNNNFEAITANAAHSITLTPKPQDAIVAAIPGATEQAVERELLAKNHLLTKGTWKVHVTLVVAGDCERPTASPTAPTVPSADEIARFADCLQEARAAGNSEADSDQDFGNDFTVGVFSYTRFVVHAEKLV